MEDDMKKSVLNGHHDNHGKETSGISHNEFLLDYVNNSKENNQGLLPTGVTSTEATNLTFFQGQFNGSIPGDINKIKTFIKQKNSARTNIFTSEYDPMTGVRTAAILGSFLMIVMFYILYKAKCKGHWSTEEDVYFDQFERKYEEKILSKQSVGNKKAKGDGNIKTSSNSIEKTRNWIHSQPLYTAIPECSDCVLQTKVRNYMHKKQSSISLEDLHLAMKESSGTQLNADGYMPCESRLINAGEDYKTMNCKCERHRRESNKSAATTLLDFNSNVGQDFYDLPNGVGHETFGAPLIRSMSAVENLLHGDSSPDTKTGKANNNIMSIPGFHETINQIVRGKQGKKPATVDWVPDHLQVNGTGQNVLSLHRLSAEGSVLFGASTNRPANVTTSLASPPVRNNQLVLSEPRDQRRASTALLNGTANILPQGQGQHRSSAPATPVPQVDIAITPLSQMGQPCEREEPESSLVSVYITPLSSPTYDVNIPLIEILTNENDEEKKNVLNTQSQNSPDYDDCPSIFSGNMVTKL